MKATEEINEEHLKELRKDKNRFDSDILIEVYDAIGKESYYYYPSEMDKSIKHFYGLPMLIGAPVHIHRMIERQKNGEDRLIGQTRTR